MPTLSRRIFLTAGGAAALVPTAADAAASAAHSSAHGSPPKAGAASYVFFNRDEAALVEAAVERLIPPDAVGPSALEAGVPRYLDLQLHGAWGAGERLYRSGPWMSGRPTQGYQLPFTPAELFRTALRGIRRDLQSTRQTQFEKLSGDEQDAYLTRLQTSTLDLDGVPSDVFFESLLAMTIEGYFSDPAYGGNQDMAAWKMIGFPGAYASYYDLIDQHGIAFTAPPQSLAQRDSGHIHLMPDIPAGPQPPNAPHGMKREGR